MGVKTHCNRNVRFRKLTLGSFVFGNAVFKNLPTIIIIIRFDVFVCVCVCFTVSGKAFVIRLDFFESFQSCSTKAFRHCSKCYLSTNVVVNILFISNVMKCASAGLFQRFSISKDTRHSMKVVAKVDKNMLLSTIDCVSYRYTKVNP